MRRLNLDEMKSVGGAGGCDDLSLSVSIAGPTVGGSVGAWLRCYNSVGPAISDAVYGLWSHYRLGIPYGQVHVG